jgi:hypothetical protein
MSSPWAVAVFVAAAALSLGASAVLVVRLERVGARLGLSEALLGLVRRWPRTRRRSPRR